MHMMQGWCTPQMVNCMMNNARSTFNSSKCNLMCHPGPHTSGLYGLAGVVHTSIGKHSCALLPVSAKHGEIARDRGSNQRGTCGCFVFQPAGWKRTNSSRMDSFLRVCCSASSKYIPWPLPSAAFPHQVGIWITAQEFCVRAIFWSKQTGWLTLATWVKA